MTVATVIRRQNQQNSSWQIFSASENGPPSFLSPFFCVTYYYFFFFCVFVSFPTQSEELCNTVAPPHFFFLIYLKEYFLSELRQECRTSGYSENKVLVHVHLKYGYAKMVLKKLQCIALISSHNSKCFFFSSFSFEIFHGVRCQWNEVIKILSHFDKRVDVQRILWPIPETKIYASRQ